MPLVQTLLRRGIRFFVPIMLASTALTLTATGNADAATTTINCDTAAANSADWATCQQLVGTASCYWNNHDGTDTVALGYRNPTDSILSAAAGTSNNGLLVIGGAPQTFASPGRLTTFSPGTSLTAFTDTGPPGGNLLATWYLMTHEFDFTTANTPACTSKPVPIMGNATAAGIALVLLVGVFALVNRRRLAKVARSPWLTSAH